MIESRPIWTRCLWIWKMDCLLVTILIILHNSSNVPELQNLTTKIQTTLTNWPEEKYVHFLDQSILNEQIGLSLNHADYFDKLPIFKKFVIFNLNYWLKHEIKIIELMFGNRFWFGDISNLCLTIREQRHQVLPYMASLNNTSKKWWALGIDVHLLDYKYKNYGCKLPSWIENKMFSTTCGQNRCNDTMPKHSLCHQ